MQNARRRTRKAAVLFLAAFLMCLAGYFIPGLSLDASAAATPTSLGFAEHGIKAYDDGWIYQAGGKGQTNSNGKRVSDCAGLLYAYFSDLGVGGCAGGASSQVRNNCSFHGDNNEPLGIPRIHGLAITAPDYVEPASGIYGHIGIYIGNGEVVDNSDYGVNMRLGKVSENYTWNAWHLFDNGMRYPVNGWYSMNGKMYHYSNYQYDININIDGYQIGADGVAYDSSGHPVVPNPTLVNDGFVSASTVANFLKSLGYSGQDSTYELIYGDSKPNDNFSHNGKITGNGVRVRSAASLSSSTLTTLSKNTLIRIEEEVTGDTVSDNGKTSSLWYKITTAGGVSGYVTALYAERTSGNGGTDIVDPPAGAPEAPEVLVSDGYVYLVTSSSDADIYYTTDNSTPTSGSTPYTGALYLLGRTYKAVAVRDGRTSPVTTATVLTNGAVFSDFTRDDWFFEIVDKAVNYNLLSGKGDGLFAPNAQITRAEFVMVMANLSGVNLSGYTNPGFADVPKGEWYAGAVAWAEQNSIISGFEDNTFRPGEQITREQMCVILANFANLTKDENSPLFADDTSIGSWAKDAVYACRDAGLVSGKGENRFEPRKNTTRAEAATVAVNYYFL